MATPHGPLKLLTGNSNRELAKAVATHLDISLANATVTKFANKGE
jgi:phosphoribosylpyrophosphate synthetase